MTEFQDFQDLNILETTNNYCDNYFPPNDDNDDLEDDVHIPKIGEEYEDIDGLETDEDDNEDDPDFDEDEDDDIEY